MRGRLLGGTRDKYEREFRLIRPTILERDNHCCVKCGGTLGLEVHHIEGYTRNEPALLATLCYLCHGVAPMHEEQFEQWKLIGETGIDVISRRLRVLRLPIISRQNLEKFCGVLLEFNLDTNRLKMKTAREKMRSSGIKCEGRKSFGAKVGEEIAFAKIRQLMSSGLNPTEISRKLNEEGTPTRSGKPWRADVMNRIVKRERNKSTLDTPSNNMMSYETNGDN